MNVNVPYLIVTRKSISAGASKLDPFSTPTLHTRFPQHPPTYPLTSTRAQPRHDALYRKPLVSSKLSYTQPTIASLPTTSKCVPSRVRQTSHDGALWIKQRDSLLETCNQGEPGRAESRCSQGTSTRHVLQEGSARSRRPQMGVPRRTGENLPSQAEQKRLY